MSLINLKFKTNYNNIKNFSGDSAILYISKKKKKKEKLEAYTAAPRYETT